MPEQTFEQFVKKERDRLSRSRKLLCALRGIGLAHTRLAKATCGRIRLALLKIVALVRSSVRRIRFAMPSAFPQQAAFRTAHERLSTAAA